MLIHRRLRTQNGQKISLGKELGRGGEGIVYQVRGMPSVAAKIYHPDKAAERQPKIAAMVAAGWHKTASTAAFPIDALFAGSTSFVGFTMPLISDRLPIHDLYSPTSRRTSFPSADFRFLVRTSLNIARAIAGVHITGCVVGDLNQSGILLAQNAIAALIDCDSFQVNVDGKTFLCKVGKEEFTPPELQGKRFDQIIRTINHDAFGLAVIIFQLLFMGRHPFAGRFLSRGDMPMHTAITEYRFAYSSRKNETEMGPPPHVPVLSDLPKEVSDAFELAFGQIGSSCGRPSAAEWVSILGRAERQVVPCQNNPTHQFFRAAASCPWCRMEGAYPGFVAFMPRVQHVSPTPVDLDQLYATITGVRPPPRSYRQWAQNFTPLIKFAAVAISAAVGIGSLGIIGTAVYHWVQTTTSPPATRDKLFISRVPKETASGQAHTAGATSTAQPPSQVAQPAVLLEQDPNNPQGKRIPGSVMWHTETVSPDPGLAPELEVRADIVIPERHIAVTLSLRRNTDKALPGSHTIQIMFNLPPDFPGEAVSSVHGIFAKSAEEATRLPGSGIPLAGITSVKVTDNNFLLGLLADPTLNVSLLRDCEWLDIAIVYKNSAKAILAIEKGPAGYWAFKDAFAAWGN